MRLFLQLLLLIAIVSASHGRSHNRRSRRQLVAPNELKITVDGRDVTLNWNFPDQQGVRFEIRYRLRGTSQWQRVNTRQREHQLRSLEAGATYEFEVYAVTRDGGRAGSTKVEVAIPQAQTRPNVGNGYSFAPVNLVVKARADQPNTLILEWEVPPNVRPLISGTTVHYSRTRDNFIQQRVNGNTNMVSIQGLKPDKEYFAKIETHFRGQPSTKSQLFKFRTPMVQPIKSINFSADQSQQLTLNWELANIDQREITQTQVFYTKNQNLPESQWQRVVVPGASTTAVLPERIQGGDKYYAKIYLTMRDGKVIKSPTIFEIDIEAARLPPVQMNAYPLKYEIVPPSTLRLHWSFPPEWASTVSNTQLMYTDNNALPESRWQKHQIGGTTADLQNLDFTRQYWVKLTPQTSSGPKPSMVYRLQPNTAVAQQVAQQRTHTHPGNTQCTDCPNERFCMKKCRVTPAGTRNSDCGTNEMCVPSCPFRSISTCSTGWCMSFDLVRSAQTKRVPTGRHRKLFH